MRALFIIFLGCVITFSCSHSKEKINEQLFTEATASGLLPFKDGDTLPPKGSSPHGPFVLKLNPSMAALLDANGKLSSTSEIPDGALIVKEVIGSDGLAFIAIMKKERKSKFAEKDWIWAEYKPDGSVYYDAKRKGGACVSCHSGSGNQDLTLTFGLH